MKTFFGQFAVSWFVLLLGLSALPALRADPERTSGIAAIPDVEVQDQNGQTLKFYSDLLKGKIVAINFLFTGCSTVCPQLGANSAALARRLVTQPDDRYRVISISIDPGADTPEQLREWSAHFGAAPGWTLVTGKRRDIDTLLRALQVYSADKNLHSGNFLLGNEASGTWRRVPRESSPDQLVKTLHELGGTGTHIAAPTAKPRIAAASYFPDVVLINQHGESRRFYQDLVKGRIVVINTIFTDCGTVCPLTVERFARVQAELGERVGRDVFLLSISVDPLTDTPEKLRAYATQAGAKPGWQFLTGDKRNVDLVLKKLGQYVEAREMHSNIIIIGNEPTGLWKKAFGLAPIDEIARVIDSVANDRR